MTYADAQTVKELSGVGPNELNNITTQAELDSLITRLNERAKSAIDEYCQRDFDYHPGVTIKVDGNGRQELSLPQFAAADGLFYPIVNLTSVSINGDALDSSDYRIKRQPNALNERNAGIIERKWARWPKGWENIEVTLDWGYETPPEEVKSIAESLIIDQLLNAAGASHGSGAESISMDGFSVTFGKRIRLTEDHKARLRQVRRVVV